MYNKILAPLDGSKLSECALEPVKEIAGGCQVKEVVLLNVVERPLPEFYDEGISKVQQGEQIQNLRDAQKQVRASAEEYLARASQNLKKQGISVQTAVILADSMGSAAEIILKYAQNNQIDLIVMSTHGRSGITRWALGSVADKVIRHSSVSVLTVSPFSCGTGTEK